MVTESAKTFLKALRNTLAPFAKVADAFDANELDDEARRFWGANDEHMCSTPLEQIELYTGRGGKRLITLRDCFDARYAIAEIDELISL